VKSRPGGVFDVAGTLTVAGQLGRDGKTWVPVPKTEASAAVIPLLPVLQRELREHRGCQAGRSLQWVQPNTLVFTTMRGKPQNRRNVLRAVYAAGDNLGLNGNGAERVGLHDLRHSFVAVAFDRGLTAPGGSPGPPWPTRGSLSRCRRA
jgi:integrase